MSQFSNFISSDGYTENGYIAAVNGLHGELRFTFRPLLVQEQAKWVKGANNMQSEAWNRQCAVLMCERIKSWSLTTDDDKPLAVTANWILRLKPALFSKLYGILLGTEPSDMDPDWTDPQKDEAATIEMDAVQEDVNVGAAREVANTKN